ncbi:MAG: 16S rRNA (adenine(1518)-N(6)/adenine(1519)-N(6))-dimethyltransferase RsmA [Parvularculaceae bacterium]|nr:16S rRNA (adenine(1518)-N(6)/adenine(1519)-N(6))-dimethyltransferase RsmA [Parvularculaceae bacterium]
MTNALPPLREVIAKYDLGAKKALGQHFLLDLNLTAKIARAANVGEGDIVLEIGPGPGGLTRALMEAGAALTVIERDARCIAALEEIADAFPARLTIIEGDAMAADERAIANGATIKIVANLPYNISTELLIKWLRANHHRAPPLWSMMALMFQKEVADRILAPPGTKTYGRLSVLAQAASRPSRAFNLPASAFTPPPKVASAVVTFLPAAAPLDDIKRLERVTQFAFSQRRKMLRSSLKGMWGDEVEAVLDACGIEPTRRAEELSVDDYLRLAAHA